MKKEKKSLSKAKVCSSCGYRNRLNASSCSKCGKERFEPDWVLAKAPIHRQLSVQITRSNPAYGESQDRITLSKWWPGGRAAFNILSPEQWQQIEKVINEDLAPLLGWKEEEILLHEAKSSDKRIRKKAISQISSQHPQVLLELIKEIDFDKLGEQEFDQVSKALQSISEIITSANAGFREAFLKVVNNLPKQKQRALEELEALLTGWTLQVITSIAQQVKSRLETIELFEKQINDERTLEIAGKNSIHRILERAMWLIDENYWLLQSNQTLRNFIGEKLSKKDARKYAKKRPDFVCGMIGNKLIILELKKPSHKLGIADLNQLESYITIAEDYKNFSSYEAYLIGKEISDDLTRVLKHRSKAFRVHTFADIIGNARERYKDYLQHLNQ